MEASDPAGHHTWRPDEELRPVVWNPKSDLIANAVAQQCHRCLASLDIQQGQLPLHASQADRTSVSVPCHFVQTVHTTMLYQTPCLENVETLGLGTGISPGSTPVSTPTIDTAGAS